MYGRHRDDYDDLPVGMLDAALMFAAERAKERNRKTKNANAGVPGRAGSRRSGG